MKEYTFRVGFLPFPHWGAADLNFFATNPTQMYVNHTGSDVLTLEAVCEVSGFCQIGRKVIQVLLFQALNCNIQFNHPVDHAWGTVMPGHISGLSKFLVDGNADLIASCQYIHEYFLNVRH